MKRYEHTTVFLSRGEIVSITNLLNQGGEGAIFETDRGGLLAKIYHSQPPKDKIKKLKLLMDYGKQAEDLGIRGIAFPKELLYDAQKQVIGFLMKRCYGKEFQYVWRDFTRSDLIAVVRKLCVYINFLHNNQIFIGDVSLGNILFDVGNKQQEFYFIDTDSFLVTGNYKMLGHTLPFEAPEMLKRVNGEVCIVENFQRDSQSDVFSVTVLLYHLLLLNDSPYLSVDSLDPILDGDVKFADWQEADCNKNRARKNWHILPSYIRQLFMDILTPKGRYYQHRNRPSMEVWLEAIKRYEEELPNLIRKNACYGQLVPDSVPSNTGASPVSSKSSPKNPFKDQFTGFASYRWSDGSVYKGHFDRGLRSGRGKMTYADGRVYEGDYLNDKRNGHGRLNWANGDCYEGDWREDQQTGLGTLNWASGDCYEGDWYEGQRTGQGKYSWSDGAFYEGDVKNGDFSGHGIKVWPSGDKYEGSWQGGDRHGYGKYTWPDGRVYEGEFQKNARTGQGTQVWSNGARYEGSWQDGNHHGRGKMTYANGDCYDGDWREDERHGRGTLNLANGVCYDGDWQNNKRHGYGKMTYVDGGSYTGDWKDGKRHGYGKMTDKYGNCYEGSWREDERHGHGTLKFASGDCYDGKWYDDQKSGHGKYIWASGIIYEGAFRNGEITGHGTKIWPDGTKYEGSWQDGKRHGHGTMTYADGRVYEGSWQGDKRHGR
ncbi:TPA: hypothetical protein ACGO0I_000464, partial [Streptococcus suis]